MLLDDLLLPIHLELACCLGGRLLGRLRSEIHALLQFRCSPLSRRFPALRALKNESVVSLITAQRRASGVKLPVVTKSYPKTKSSTLAAQLYFAEGATAGKWDTYLHGHQGHLETRKVLRVTHGADGDKVFAQRDNEVWQWAGHVCPGRKRWLCSGRASAQHDVERHFLEVCAFSATTQVPHVDTNSTQALSLSHPVSYLVPQVYHTCSVGDTRQWHTRACACNDCPQNTSS